MFETYDEVVYPGHGVGTIVSSEVKEVFGKRQQFFTVKILNSGMKIMLPSENAKICGLRKVMQRHAIRKAFTLIEQGELPEQIKTWNIRYRNLMEMIKTGQFVLVGQAIRQIKAKRGELSFGERSLLGVARELIAGELMLAFKLSYADAYAMTIDKVG